MKKALTSSILMAVLMAAAAIGGVALRPTPLAATSGEPKFVLNDAIPRQFGDWRELPNRRTEVVNPQTQELIDKLYSQVLTRVYINSQGYQVMLSLAYGDDQRGSLTAHMPEVCYPAQGFDLLDNTQALLTTQFGNIPARRLQTRMGRRAEPVTYWFAVGDSTITSSFQRRLVELRSSLTGQIPDGLLFRVSSLDDAPDHAYSLHRAFVDDLLSAVGERDRRRLIGPQRAGGG